MHRKYRSPSDEPIRVVTDTGHITHVGPEWTELPPIYHHAAVNSGCEVDSAVVSNEKTPLAASASAEQRKAVDVLIEGALKTMLERDDAEDFNNGQPKVDVVAKLAGVTVNRKQITPVWERLKEEAKADAGASGGGR
ncbi:MAG: hypothetical protein HOQ02_04395 [Lysobacter sp.]|nr:hypothetical protein [Lysobacter sp.]